MNPHENWILMNKNHRLVANQEAQRLVAQNGISPDGMELVPLLDPECSSNVTAIREWIVQVLDDGEVEGLLSDYLDRRIQRLLYDHFPHCVGFE